MPVKRKPKAFSESFSDKPGLFVESCICDGCTRAVSQSYIDRSRQINVNWNRGEHGIGLFRGILYFRQ